MVQLRNTVLLVVDNVKKINCPDCKAVALGGPTSAYPNGAPVVVGRFTAVNRPMVIKCNRCTKSFRIDAIEFNALPEMTQKEAEELVGTPLT